MRRSLGGGGGRNMGGGGGMIRTVHRAIRAGAVGGTPPESLSCSAASTNSRTPHNFNDKQYPSSGTCTALTLSSSGNNNNGTSAFSSLINFPSSSSFCGDESEWECIDGNEEEEEGRAVVFYDEDDNNDVFATVPSTDEVHHAVSALQRAFSPKVDKNITADEVASFEKPTSSEMDWIEPSPRFCNSKMLQQLNGPDRSVYDAFHLLETEPCVQRMVISLSSDKAVWDAVLNNEVVKELRGSISEEGNGLMDECSEQSCDDSDSDANYGMKDIVSWIVENGKAKIMQVMESIRKMVCEAFKGDKDGGDCATDPFQEKLKTSLLLSVMVLIVVVITRTTTKTV